MRRNRSLASILICIVFILSTMSVSASIQEKVDAADPGDTITVAAGTYKENIYINKSLTINGAGADNTIIDGNRTGSVFTIGPNIFVTLSGMTIHNGGVYGGGRQSGGGGVYNRGALHIIGCTISDNIAWSKEAVGGGVYNSGSATFTECIVSENLATHGGGVYNNGSAIFIGTTISTNQGAWYDSGAGVYNNKSATTTFVDSIISDNLGLWGAGVYNDGLASFTNTTISGNRATNYGGGGGIYNAYSGNLIIEGTTQIINNEATSGYGGGIYSSSDRWPSVTFNGTNIVIKSNKAHQPDKLGTIWSKQYGVYLDGGGTAEINGFDPSTQVTGNTYINNPPDAYRPEGSLIGSLGIAYTYSVQVYDLNEDYMQCTFDWDDGSTNVSSLVKSGRTSASHAWSTPGTYQIKAKATDSKGASSEWSYPLAVFIEGSNRPPDISSTPSGYSSGSVGILYSYSTSAMDPDGNQVKYTFDWGDGSTDITNLVDSGTTASASHAWSNPGTYQIKAKATDSKGASSGWSEGATVIIAEQSAPGIIDACHHGCGYSSIQAAIDAANPGDTINVAEDTYKEEVHIYKSLTIRGAGAGKTIVDGNQDGTVFIIDPGINVKLSGMTIQNGIASPTGGGIFNRGKLTISDITITRNSAGASGGGAGIYNAGTLTMNSGTVSGNSITTETFGYGIGVYNSGTFTMNSGTISENSASGTNHHGGGVYNVGTFSMNGGTISENSITGTNCLGGGVSNHGDGTFTMNGGIISGNYADYGGGIANSGSLFIGGTSQIKDNQATTSYGGGIESDNSQVTFEGKNVAVKCNQARLPFPSELSWYQGWGVYIASGMPTMTGGFDPENQVKDNTLITSNHRPNKPSAPTGSAISVKYYSGPAYAFSTSTTDPDGDQVKYIFEWGDDRVPITTDSVVSGATASKSHIWDNAGSYQVRVRAIDSHGASSEWSDPLAVTINNPVILIYGIFGEVDSLNPIATALRNNDMSVLKFDFAPEGKETACGDIKSYARQLEGFIEDQKKTTKIKKFDIVAHSMGGLISRWYIEKMSGADHVDKLIMLGTPNHGSHLFDPPSPHLSDLFVNTYPFRSERWLIGYIFQVGIRPMQPAMEMMKYHSDFLNSLGYDGRSDYYIIGGTEPHDLKLKMFASPHIKDRQKTRGLNIWLNDGAVAVEDVYLNNAASIDYFEIDHLEELSLKQDGQNYWDEIDKIISILKGSSTHSANKEDSAISNNTNETPVQSLPSIADTIYPSNEKYHDINISFAQYAQIYLLGQEGNLSFNLTTPSGKSINKSVLQDGVTYLEESSNSIAKGYEIENPEAGTWKAYVKAMDVSSNGENYTILTYIGTNLTLSILPAKYHLNPNEPIEIGANLTNDSLPVAGANLVAYYVKPDLSIEHQILYDDGLHNDSLSNDGIYANAFKNTSLRGTYQITVIANGSLKGIDFMRLGSISVWAELYSDLTINPFDISFSNPSPMPDEEVKLNATIRNVGNISANNASILFFAGPPVLENLIGQAAINVSADETVEANTTWNAEPGLHQISVWVSPCNEFLESNYSNNMASRIISVESPPTPLNTPSGPTSGIPGTSYSYTTLAVDPDGDQIAYTFDWGDGANSTTGLFDSGAIASAAHIWNNPGIYQVRAMATDNKGASSEWSDSLAVSINALSSSTLYYPDFTDTADPNSWRSWLVLQNPNEAATNVTLSIRSRSGDMLYAGDTMISPYGVSAIRPRNLVGADCAGSVIVSSDQPITGTCQITRNSNEMCMGYNALDGGSTVLYYPDFTDTANPDGWRSWLVIQNPAASPANLDIEIRSRAGDILYSGEQIIPAHGVNAIRPRNLAGSDCAGSVFIESDLPVIGTCQITRNSNQMCMSYTASDHGSTALYYPDFTDTANPDGWRSWLVLQNPSDAPANLNYEIRSRAGDILYAGSDIIPAHGVNAVRPRNLAGADCSGSVVVTSDQPIVGTCQITRNSNQMCMSYNALDQVSTTLSYPDFTDTANPDGWRSWLVLQNPTAADASITLEIRSREGDLLYGGDQIIPAHGVNAIRPRSLVGSDCSGSVVVTSDQPIVGTCQITRNNNLMCMSYTASGATSV